MAAPLIRRRRVLAAKVETTVGTAIALAAADATYNVYNANIEPTIQFLEREGQGTALSPITGALAAYSGTLTFSCELKGGATIPAAIAAFWPACGLKDTSDTFTPDSRPPEAASSGTKTLTMGVYQDGLLKAIHGAMGNAVFRFTSGAPAMIDYTFVGGWSAPTDVALLAPTYETAAPLRFVSSTFLLGDEAALRCAEVTLDLGNTIALRQDARTATGVHSAVITGRRIRGTMTIESQLVAEYDPHGDWLARTERQLSFSLGTTGNAAAFTIPKLQITNVRPGEINGVAADVIDFTCNRSAAAGDDELSIVIT